MHSLRIAVPLLVLLLCAAAPATAATTLYTAPQRVDNGLNNVSMWCTITNVSTKPVEVTAVELLGFNGDLIIRVEGGPFTLGPLQSGGTFSYDNDSNICRFTFNAPAKAVRASSCVHQLNVGCIATTPAQ
jgi:hypothetical protein